MAAAAHIPGRPRAALEVGRARLHGAVPGDRDRLSFQLDSVRPSAVGVPARAILVVPRLVARKRLPRQGDCGLVFAESVTDALRVALRRARRPGEAHSPHDSLLFLDEADAMACLIAQWLAGVAPADRGWWRHFTGGAAPPAWWRREILPDARRLPAIVATLALRGLAEAWLGRLEPEDVRTALAAMEMRFGLSLPAPRTAPPGAGGGDPGVATPAMAEAIALLDAVVPEARRTCLPPAARLLLIVTLLVERRPAMPATRAAKAAFAAAASGTLPALSSPPPRSRPPAAAVVGKSAARKPDVRARAKPRPAPPAIAIEPARKAAPGARPALPELPPEGETGTRRDAAPRPREPAVAEAAPAPAEIATGYGGILFLLNALLALGLYGDFSQPRRSLAGLSPFGLLRLLGRSWFGRSFVEDPIHALLVRLAGGRRADAARDFEAPPWSVPRAWLSPWPKPGRGAARGWHPAGFPLGRRGPAARLTRARWVRCLRLYLEARIATALGFEDRAEAVAMLCRRPARIAVEGEDVTARFILDDHPIAIRLAGLDRDPGWIPAAGRSFRYMFE